MTTRIGVDVGGTFTDVVVYDEDTGAVTVAKSMTTRDRPDLGIASTLDTVEPSSVVPDANYFLHGTTVGLNALLQRSGASVAVLTTKGFRDVLAIRRGVRGDHAFYDALYQPEPPLVPRYLRLGVTERILADGTVDTPLEAAEVRDAARELGEHGVDAVAICFINSYANPTHEHEAAAILREAGFSGEISVASAICREYREYERTSTTVIDAYVRPLMTGYLDRLSASLDSRGFAGQALITRSGGGSMHFDEAGSRPVETIMSGPVAGAVGAGELCSTLGLSQAITADVGGTSFDTCLIIDGRPTVKYEGHVGDMPVLTPWVDVRSIGAGGGSIAWIDHGGLLRVGPRSAGASPGPVCYGRGGTAATTTDAAAFLGMLGIGELAGDLQLDLAATAPALDAVGSRLSLSTEQVASGILRIAGSAMADAIRSVSIEQGEDPRNGALIAFGGAGPLFATILANELDLDTIVVPPHAGNFSAWGLLGQDITRTGAVTSIAPLDERSLEEAMDTLRELCSEFATTHGGRTRGAGIPTAALDLRYVGQEHSLTVELQMVNGDATVDGVLRDFSKRYRRTFGHTLDGPVEIVAVRAASRVALPRGEHRAPVREGGMEMSAAGVVDAYSFKLGKRTEFTIWNRELVAAGMHIPGPAIVVEPTATTYIDAGFGCEIHQTGSLFVTRDPGEV